MTATDRTLRVDVETLDRLRFFVGEMRRLEDEQTDFADMQCWDALWRGAALQVSEAVEAILLANGEDLAAVTR